MPVPTRPVSGASIAAEWGQEIHDYTFAPKGCIADGAAVAMLAGAAYRTLPLDVAVSDPGGWLDAVNDRLEVPTGAEGLYYGLVWATSDDGASTDETRVVLRINGSEVGRGQMGQEGGTAITILAPFLGELTAGDLIDCRALQVGSGTRANVEIRRLAFVRLGAELGA